MEVGKVNKFFTSDLHFYHKNICDFCNRPWNQEENEARLVELWNRQVHPGDVVWHLGDFFFLNNSGPGVEKALGIIEQLNGRIHCILGNHDNGDFFKALMKRSNKIAFVDRLKEINIGEGLERKKLVMCHYPLFTFNCSHRGAIAIHGHEHGRIHAPGKVIDVGLDGAIERLGEHRFWTESDILEYAAGLEINNPSERKYNR